MIVLGICDSQDSGAALFVDGRLVAAVNEERLNRVKLWGGFPAESIRTVLRLGGVEPRDVEKVVLGTRITPNLLARAVRGIHQGLRRKSGQFGYLLSAFIAYQAAARRLVVPEAAEAAVARVVMRKNLAEVGIGADVVSIDHHLAHAASAWATSPFDRALVVTVDGLGDGLGLSVRVGERGRGLRVVHDETGFSAITLYYSRLTEMLGFTPIKDEGKVNALAAMTDEMPALPLARSLLSHRDGSFSFQNHLLPARKDRPPYSEMRRWTREQVAASFQAHLEEVMREFLRHWLKATGTRNVCFAGGLFANVKLNQRVAAMDEVEGVYVFPHMGDGGLAVGGALAWLKADPEVMPDVYLGPGPTDAAVRDAVAGSGLPATRPADLEAEVARMLADGRIVARFDGRMEFGPRALGNRSILVQATDPTTIDWLNERLKRSRFMPFAPSMLDAEFDACIVGGGKARHTAQFMNISFDVTRRMRTLCPGAVHVDGTARPQRVTDEAAPAFARILREYRRLTGLPAVVNTSFNMHEEPIVCSPGDAISAFTRARLDALAIGPYLVTHPDAGPEAAR
jgi:carbamoyltransferase